MLKDGLNLGAVICAVCCTVYALVVWFIADLRLKKHPPSEDVSDWDESKRHHKS